MEFTKMEIIRKINGLKEELMKMKENGEQSKLLSKDREMQIIFEKCILEKKLEQKEYKPFGLPFELMDALFASLPFQNAFNLLGKVPNGLLARNVEKMTFIIKMAIKQNKWNVKDCGQLAIKDDGLVLDHSGQNELYSDSVRAVMPIPMFDLKCPNKSIITFYYEIAILKGSPSIGMFNEQISINKAFANGFALECLKQGDVAGIGMVQQPNKIELFCTLNGHFLGKAPLPPTALPIWPAVNLYAGDSVRARFNNEEWSFQQFQLVLKEMKEKDGGN